MEKPDVLIISASKLSRGGVESHLLSLFTTLADQVNFTLMADCSPELAAKLAQLNIEYLPWQVLDFKSVSAAKTQVRRRKPDLVHIHDPRAGLLLRPLLFLMRVPVVYTVHLPPYYFYAGKGLASALRTALYRAAETALNWLFTDKIIYVSEHVYQEALKKQIAPKRRSMLIPTGIDTRRFSHPTTDEPLTTENNKLVVINISRHHPEKNVMLVLAAAEKLLPRYDNLEFWLVGDGPQTDELKRTAQRLKMHNRIRFLGARDDIPQLLARSDIFLLTSHYEGGRSIAIQEAQSAGKPAVVSNVGDNNQLVDHLVNGWVFEEGNLADCVAGLEYLLENPQFIPVWGGAAQEKAATQYDQTNNNQGVFQIYRNLDSLRR